MNIFNNAKSIVQLCQEFTQSDNSEENEINIYINMISNRH